MKLFLPYIIGAVLAVGGYQLLGTAMYTYHLAKFYEVDWSFEEHGIALNGYSAFGSMINVSDIQARVPKSGGGPVEEWCEGVTSKRGHLTLGFVGEISVCCWPANDHQYLVPFKTVGNERHYLCGKWPHLDHVYQSLDRVKLKDQWLQ